MGHFLFTDDKAKIHAKTEDKEEYGAIFWQQTKPDEVFPTSPTGSHKAALSLKSIFLVLIFNN